MRTPLLALLTVLSLLTAPCPAQSGIQWSGNARDAVALARERGVPVMFWVTERTEYDDDAADDLKDAQEDAFRDPAVLGITQRDFVPCRVARSNSNVLAEAERLGLPTGFGLYIALISPEGALLDTIDPGQVADPGALADRLAAASRAYRDAMYDATLKAVIADPEAPKSAVRRAVRTVWQLRIYGADRDVVGLLSRPDLTDTERSRLYQLLGAFATAPCIEALLDAAPADQKAAAALARADLAAIPVLLDAMPGSTGQPAARDLIAYRTLTTIARVRSAKPDDFWAAASQAERAAELDRVRAVAESVHEAWYEMDGRWR